MEGEGGGEGICRAVGGKGGAGAASGVPIYTKGEMESASFFVFLGLLEHHSNMSLSSRSPGPWGLVNWSSSSCLPFKYLLSHTLTQTSTPLELKSTGPYSHTTAHSGNPLVFFPPPSCTPPPHNLIRAHCWGLVMSFTYLAPGVL
jgi:hypothetical protein